MPEYKVDAIIVGAGLSGAVTANELAKAGLTVICLEQGDWPEYGRSAVHRRDSEVAAEQYWQRDPNVRQDTSDYPIDDSGSDVAALMWNGVGGSSVLYLAKWNRMTPGDFRVRSHDGVADDWPLSYKDLEPHYLEAERQFQISGLAGDPAYPKGDGPPNPPLPIRPFGARMATALNELGWSWWPGASATFPDPEHSTKEGPESIKASTDVTHWPSALKAGAELRTNARVRRVLVENGEATGCEYIDGDGNVQTLHARSVILCANGIGTPRLLLLSATDEYPDGLANSSGLVGKRLMLHPFGAVAGLFDDDLDTAVSPLGQQIQSMHFYETDASRGFVRGAKWGLQPTGGPLAVTRSYPWEVANEVMYYENFHKTLKARFNRAPMWTLVAEDLPVDTNRVTLSDTLVDGDGLPGAKIEYVADANSRALLKFHTEKAAESLIAAGAVETVVAPLVRSSGWHLMGTAVMGDDPANSVTDRYGTTHDVKNLHIFDSSTWVTSGGVNPVATQAALALWSSTHFLDEWYAR